MAPPPPPLPPSVEAPPPPAPKSKTPTRAARSNKNNDDDDDRDNSPPLPIPASLGALFAPLAPAPAVADTVQGVEVLTSLVVAGDEALSTQAGSPASGAGASEADKDKGTADDTPAVVDADPAVVSFATAPDTGADVLPAASGSAAPSPVEVVAAVVVGVMTEAVMLAAEVVAREDEVVVHVEEGAPNSATQVFPTLTSKVLGEMAGAEKRIPRSNGSQRSDTSDREGSSKEKKEHSKLDIRIVRARACACVCVCVCVCVSV
jgi:hypothetical protein